MAVRQPPDSTTTVRRARTSPSGGLGAQAASLVVVVVAILASPMALRLVNRAIPGARAAESYIPAVEAPRTRLPFNARAVNAIKSVAPDYVVIGDSMAGSRIHHRRLSELVGGRGVVPIFEPATGSVYWYLAFKNWVVAGDFHPKAVVFFFRDENLTDPMFRITPSLVDRVALDREPRLNDILAARAQGTFFRVHALARGLYQFDRTRAWLEPAIARAPVSLSVRRQARQSAARPAEPRGLHPRGAPADGGSGHGVGRTQRIELQGGAAHLGAP